MRRSINNLGGSKVERDVVTILYTFKVFLNPLKALKQSLKIQLRGLQDNSLQTLLHVVLPSVAYGDESHDSYAPMENYNVLLKEHSKFFKGTTCTFTDFSNPHNFPALGPYALGW